MKLQQMKSRYNKDLEFLQGQLKKATVATENGIVQIYDEIYKTLESIMTCKETSESYLKALLEYMIIHKDGTVELKLNQLPTIWRFQLQKGNH